MIYSMRDAKTESESLFETIRYKVSQENAPYIFIDNFDISDTPSTRITISWIKLQEALKSSGSRMIIATTGKFLPNTLYREMLD